MLSNSPLFTCTNIVCLLFFCNSATALIIKGPNHVNVHSSFVLSLEPLQELAILSETELQGKSENDRNFTTIATLGASSTSYQLTLAELGKYEFRMRYRGALYGTPVMSEWSDIFVVQLDLPEEVVSVNGTGELGNFLNWSPGISTDGRYVGFFSQSNNLMSDTPPVDTNAGGGNIIVRDRVEQRNFFLNKNTDGTFHTASYGAPSFSPDGQHAVYLRRDGRLVIRNFLTRSLTIVPRLDNYESYFPQFSDNGRYVVYIASLSVRGRPVFVYDMVTGEAMLATEGWDGKRLNRNIVTPPSISANGRYIAFSTSASNTVPEDTDNLEDVFLLDRVTGSTTLISRAMFSGAAGGTVYASSLSADGTKLVFSSTSSNLVLNDTNGVADVFLFDLNTSEIIRVSAADDNSELKMPSMNAMIDQSGQYINYNDGHNHYVYNRLTKERNLVIRGASAVTSESLPVMSRNGKFLAIQASNNPHSELIKLAPIPQ